MKLYLSHLTKPEGHILTKEGLFSEVPENEAPRALRDDHQGELATVLVVATLTQAVIFAVVAYKLKTNASEKIKEKLIFQTADGAILNYDLEINRSSSEAPNAQALGQVRQFLENNGLPPLQP